MTEITTEKSITSISIKGEQNISYLFTAMCFVIDNCKEDEHIGIVEAKEILGLCKEIREKILE